MTRTAYLIFLLLILLNINAQGQNLETNVEGIGINGNEYKRHYRVFVSSNGKWIEATRTNSGFIVPKGLSNEQRVRVRFIFDKYNLIFPEIKASEFNVKWFIGIYDNHPFPETYVSQKEDKLVKRIYYIKFTTENGQEITQLVKEKKKYRKLKR